MQSLTHPKFTENPISRRLCFDLPLVLCGIKGKNFEHSLPRDRQIYKHTCVYMLKSVCVHTQIQNPILYVNALEKNVKQSCELTTVPCTTCTTDDITAA